MKTTQNGFTRRVGQQGLILVVSVAVTLTAGSVMPLAIAGPGHSAASYVVFGTRDEDHGRWASARDNFRQAIALDHKCEAAYVGLGRAYQHLGENQKAHEAFRQALEITPQCSQAENGWHETMSDAENAQWFAVLTTRADQMPNDADVQTTYATELLSHGRSDEAALAAKTALRLNPKMSHATCVLGRVALAAGRGEEAKSYLTEAAQADRNDDAAWAALGDLETKQNDYPGAVDAYSNAIKSAPEHADYYDKIAIVLDAAGRHEEAMERRAQAARVRAEKPHLSN